MTDNDNEKQAQHIKHRCEAMQHLTHEFIKSLTAGRGHDIDPATLVETAQALAEAELQFMHRIAEESQEQINALIEDAQSPEQDEQDSEVIPFPFRTH